MSYPTPSQIGELFKQMVSSDPSAFVAKLDPNINLHITGHNHEFSGKIQGKEDLLAKHVAPIVNMIDKDKHPVQREVIRVIGGGDSAWAAVELKDTSTTKKGKPWVHENAYVVHFTAEGMIDELRGYYDSAHLNKHAGEAKA